MIKAGTISSCPRERSGTLKVILGQLNYLKSNLKSCSSFQVATTAAISKLSQISDGLKVTKL